MTKETVTMHTAYSWVERNHIGPVPVLHYGSRQFDFDQQDGEALAEACSDLPTKDYPHRDVLSPGPNKSRKPHNVLSTAAFLMAIELAAGLIWVLWRML